MPGGVTRQHVSKLTDYKLRRSLTTALDTYPSMLVKGLPLGILTVLTQTSYF
jgi:hypothetical protein